MVAQAVLKMKEGKACSPSRFVIEMVKAACDTMPDFITDMINLIKKNKLPDGWDYSAIMNC